MKAADAIDVAQRAVEGGAIDEQLVTYFRSRPNSPAESGAIEKINEVLASITGVSWLFWESGVWQAINARSRVMP